ncbi:MAG: NAD+ synthase (glutamine-hydrolyzing) [Pseudoalteromonas tetraodonis]|jgi:NAD+ synthase (glutamine-hydrolysing)
MQELRVAMAQLNFLVGDIPGNCQKILDAANISRDQHHADLVLFSELALCGYPPEDLLFRPGFQKQILTALERLCVNLKGIDIVVGFPEFADDGLYNSAAHISNGAITAIYRKQCLPNYGVFDEARYFSADDRPQVISVRGHHLGLLVCEDAWHPDGAMQAKDAGATALLCLNASPFNQQKLEQRHQHIAARCAETSLPIIYANQIGGQDELVFDGYSFAADADGKVVEQLVGFEESIQTVLLNQAGELLGSGAVPAEVDHVAEVYSALVLGVKDYVKKNGFPGVVLGLSGGVDSALTLAIAVDALGSDRVEAVAMPSRYTADISNNDAEEEARMLGVHFHTIAIEDNFAAFENSLASRFEGLGTGTTEENIQARIRGVLLMAISNKTGSMVLTTSNKSETAIGYATLYGDMAGGFGPLKDVNKSLVYALCRYRNSVSPAIPERVLTRPPTAELRADQKDSDSLPPYEILDPILSAWIEGEKSITEIVSMGYEAEVVQRIVGMITRNEYKRRQSSPGVKITPLAFGRDRRYPITSGYRSTF